MTTPYAPILRYFQKKQIALEAYAEFLSVYEKSILQQISNSLEQKGVSLSDYYHYLENKHPSLPLKKAETPNPLAMSLQKIEYCGQKILAEKKLSLSHLNRMLQSLESPQFNLFLQKLLQERMIDPEEFILFFQKQWSPTDSLYRLQTTPYLSFYLDLTHASKSYGPYQVLEELGRGGMGIVYKAYHAQLNRIVALKILLTGTLASEKSIARFLREIEVMAKLQHPNILQIYDSGREKDELYFAMEYVEGASLSSQASELTLREKLTIMQQTLEALDYAHQQGILHRDLKLDNILLTQEGYPKIADFGLAKEKNEEKEKLTASGILLGTAPYMAPEQAKGNTHAIDAQTDIYAMGVCLYVLLTNHYPFEAKTLPQLLHKIIHELPTDPSAYSSVLHPDLKAILFKSLEKEKAKRYATAQAFAKDLEHFLHGIPIETLSESHYRRFQRWKIRHKRTVYRTQFLLIITLVLIVFAFFIQWRDLQQQVETQLQKVVQLEQQSRLLNKSQQVGHFLQMWHLLNQALSVHSTHPKSLQKKWEIGEKIMQQSLNSKEYHLGDYILRGMLEIPIINDKSRQEQKIYWDTEREKIARKEIARFQFWTHRLRSQQLSEQEQKEACYEILKMEHSSIHENLLLILKEGNEFIQERTFLSEAERPLFDFYLVMIKCIGQKKISQAEPLLTRSIEKIGKEQVLRPKGQQNLFKIHYIAEQTRTMALLKAIKILPLLEDLREQMGKKNLYTTQTKRAYRHLLRQKRKVFSSQENEPSQSSTHYFFQEGKELIELEQFKEAIYVLSQAIQQEPKTPKIYIKRGIAYHLQKDFEEAIRDFSQAIQLAPQNAEAYNHRGNTYNELKNYSKAIHDFSQAIQLQPQNEEFYSNRAITHIKTKEFSKAVLDSLEALRIHPQYLEAYHHLGISYANLEEWESAQKTFKQILQLNPQDTVVHAHLGNLYFTQKKWYEAIAEYDQVISLDPNQENTYNNRGLAKYALGDLSGAIFDYTEAIRCNPRFEEPYYNRGTAMFILGKINEAIPDFTEAIRLRPTYVEAYNNRGGALFRLGRSQEAILDYTEAIRLQPETIHYLSRGQIYHSLRQFQKAKEDLKIFLQVARETGQLSQYRPQVQWIHQQFPELKDK